ncbi:PEGA domain-containing protein [bacterium]|nr:PEGA domain-containing protein [bacterium]
MGIYGTLSTVYCYPWQVIGTPTPVNVSIGSTTSGIDFELSQEVKDLLGPAVDNTELIWTTSGNANWFRQTEPDYTYDNEDAAQSGYISNSGSTSIQTTVSCAGTLTFYWKVSSQSGSDYLRFSIDDIEKAKISGGPGWNQQSCFIPQGTHTIKWAYTKDSSGSGGKDCGWLDKVEFIQGKITGAISYSDTKSGTLYYSAFDNPQFTGTPTAEGTRIFSGPGTVNWTLGVPPGTYYVRVYLDADNNKIPTVGDPIDIYGNLSTVYYPWQVIGTPAPVGVDDHVITPDINFGLSRMVEEKVSLLEAVDATGNLEFTGWETGGNGTALWFGQTDYYCYGTAAAQSGYITHNQQTYLQTQVVGTGTLNFYWKVSSQSYCDYLRFSIEGNEQDAISGEAGWTKTTYFIPAGTHTLKWAYAKDSSVSSGSDCGWLDKVEFIPWGQITGSVLYTGTKSGALHSAVFNNQQFIGTPIAEKTTEFNGPGSVNYALEVPPGTYYLRAYLDVCHDGGPTEYDPIGIYGSLSAAYYPWQIISTPEPVGVGSRAIVSGKDIELNHKVILRNLLAEGLDNAGLVWKTGGAVNWLTDYYNYFYGNASAQSDRIQDNQETYIQTEVTGTGTLKFYWKVSSQSNYDYLRFSIDGIEQDKISSAREWTQMSYVVSGGTHTLKWVYTKDSSGYSGSDCGWIDRVEFIPWGGISGVISYTGTKTGSLYYSAFDNQQLIGTPIDKGTGTFSGPGTVSYSLEAYPGTYYLRAYLDADNDKIPSVNDPVGIYGSLSLVYCHPWQVIGTPTPVIFYSGSITSRLDFGLKSEVKDFLGEAVDKPEFVWTTGGNADWFGQTAAYYYDGDAARSGAISNYGSTSIQTTVASAYPGTLTFSWKVSSQSGDYLRFYIDGNEQNAICGAKEWTQMSYVLPAGTHTLKWAYTKDSSSYSGSDCGWIDRLQFIPWGRISGAISYTGTKTGSLYYSAFTNPQFTGTPIAGGTGTFSGPGTVNYSLEIPEGTYSLRAYLDVDDDMIPSDHEPVGICGSLSLVYCHPWQIVGTPTLVNVYSGSTTQGMDFGLSHNVQSLIGEAVDNTELIWTTGGAANWFRQTDSDYSYYGGDAAQSGKIDHGKETYIQTTVTSPGTLTFYWKVSSEGGCDYLRFYIDGLEQSKISNEVDWTQMSYFIPLGTHTLTWAYIKNDSYVNGKDCGWVDKVGFTQASVGKITGVIFYAGTKTGSLYYAAFDNPQFNGKPAAEGVTEFSGQGTLSYTLKVLPGTYYLRAYIDIDGNRRPSENDQVGLYGTLSTAYYPWQIIGTPTAVYVPADSIAAGIDFELTHNIESKEKEWTFMVYLDGDNKLESSAIADFIEMANVGSDDYINIVVQFDRINGYDSSYDNWTTTKRFYVTREMTPTKGNALEDIGEANMGDPTVLADFMNWAMSKYPAKRYTTILCNHGGGWKQLKAIQPKLPYKEICVDDTSKDVLFMEEVKEALATTTTNLGQKIDLVGFDACLMGMIEVGYWIKDYAGVMVGSEESEPGYGWPYTPILSMLTQNPTMPAKELSKIMVQEYIKSYGSMTYNVTLSAIDLDKIHEVGSCTNNLVNLINNGYWDKIKYARDNVQEYSDRTHIDLSHFVRRICAAIPETNIQNTANRLIETIDSAIIANGEKGYPDSHGLAIYLPDPNPVNEQSYDENYDYIDFARATIWDEFLKSYYDNYVKGTITMLGSSAEVLPGGIATYSITYRNIGATPFFCGMINDILPPELEFVGSNPPYSGYAPNFYSWKVGTITPYQGGTITIIALAATNTLPGSWLENKAELCNGSKNLLCSSTFSVHVNTPIMGSLTINSTPSGAKIYIDNVDTNKLTNWTSTILTGTHTIRLTLSGYTDWRRSVLITTGTTTIVEAVLDKAAPVMVYPSRKIVNVKDEFEIDIKVGTVTSLYGFQFDMRFNPNLLEVVSVTEGTFLKSDGGSTDWVSPTIGTDSILAGCTRCGTITGVSGTGTLAVIRLKSKGVGTSSIELSNIILKDNSTPIPQTISAIPCNGVISAAPWDVVRNDKIDITDLSTVGIHFGETTASHGFYPPADINEDENINITDLSTVGIHFGENYAAIYKCPKLSSFAPFLKPLILQKPLVKVDQGVQSAANGTQFSVDIKVGSVTNLYGFQFDIRFDPNLLEVVSVIEGTFLKSDGTYTTWVSPTTGTGSISNIGCTRLGTTTGVSGTGTLAVIKFRAKSEGVSLLDLQNVLLKDNSLPVTQDISSDVADGTVTITTGLISSIFHNALAPLGIGKVLTVTMQGQAGGKATFTVIGIAATTMTETSSGTYTGSYTVKAGDNIIGGTVTGYLTIGTTTYTKDATPTVTLDTISPTFTVTVSPNPAKAGTVSIIVTASEQLAGTPGLTAKDSAGGTISTVLLVDANPVFTYSGTLTAVQGTATVNVSGSDLVGNFGSRSATFRVDTIPATFAIEVPAYVKEGTFTVKVTANEKLKGTPSVTIKDSGSNPIAFELISAANPVFEYRGSITLSTAQGMAAIEVLGTDSADNTSTQAVSFKVDTAAPVFTIISSQNSSGVGTLTIIVTPDELLKATPTLTIKDSANAAITAALIGVANGTCTYQATITSANADGTATIIAGGTDLAENIGNASKIFQISIPRILLPDDGISQAATVTTILQPFVVKLTDSLNKPMSGYTVKWEIAAAPSSSVLSSTITTTNAEGLASTTLTLGTKSGTYIVTAKGDSLMATFTAIAAPGTLTQIKVSPDTAYVSVHQPFVFTATGYDGYNNKIEGLIYDWSKEGDIGSLTSAVGTATILNAASILTSGTITAGTQGISGIAKVETVNSQLTNVTVTSATSTVEMQGSQSFTAQGLNQYGSSIAGATYTWTLEPATGRGTISTTTTQTVLFTASGAGTASLHVKAEFGTQTVATTTTITVVNGVVHHIDITSAMAAIEARGTTSFTAEAFNQHGYPLTGITQFNWQVTVGSGTISGSPGKTVVLVTNDVVGTLTLTASTSTVTGITTVAVTHGSVSVVSVNPPAAEVEAMSNRTFTASAVNRFGHPIPAAVLSYSWGLNSLIGGSITPTTSATATFTAGSRTGGGIITAEAQGKKATATVTVTPGQVARLAFVPLTAGILTTGMAGAMTIQTQDQFGNSIPATTATTIFVCGVGQSRFAEVSSGAIWTTSGTFTITGTSNLTFFFKQNDTTTPAIVTAAILGATTTATCSVTILSLSNSSSGTVIGDDGKTMVKVGTGTLAGAGYIEIDTTGASTAEVLAGNARDDADLRINRVEGTLRRFTIHNNAAIASIVRIAISYQDSDPDDGFVDGVTPLMRVSSLAIYHLAGTGIDAFWKKIDSSWVDKQNNVVYADVPSFSFFQLMGIGFESTSEKALVYPNPYYADKYAGIGITFDRLSIDSTIKIFTIAGELVWETRVNSPQMRWDVCNSVGERVASGIYIYLIKDPVGNEKVGKLGVIR